MASSLLGTLFFFALTHGVQVQAMKQEAIHIATKKGGIPLGGQEPAPCVNVVELIRQKFRNTLEKEQALKDLAEANGNYQTTSELISTNKVEAETRLSETDLTAQETDLTAQQRQDYLGIVALAEKNAQDISGGVSTSTGVTAKVVVIKNGDPVSVGIKGEVANVLQHSKSAVTFFWENVKLGLLNVHAAVATWKSAEVDKNAELSAKYLVKIGQDQVAAESHDLAMAKKMGAAKAASDAANIKFVTARAALATAKQKEGACKAYEMKDQHLLDVKDAEIALGEVKVLRTAAIEEAAEEARKLGLARQAFEEAGRVEAKLKEKEGSAQELASNARKLANKGASDRLAEQNAAAGKADQLAAEKARLRAAKIMDPTKHYTFDELQAMKARGHAVA